MPSVRRPKLLWGGPAALKAPASAVTSRVADPRTAAWRSSASSGLDARQAAPILRSSAKALSAGRFCCPQSVRTDDKGGNSAHPSHAIADTKPGSGAPPLHSMNTQYDEHGFCGRSLKQCQNQRKSILISETQLKHHKDIKDMCCTNKPNTGLQPTGWIIAILQVAVC
jgi:hypothetical protein